MVTPVVKPTPSESSKQPRRPLPLDNGELKKTGFWLNQVFMIVSTIVGVYLAAQSGLEQALKFDTLSKIEDNYYLRVSLYDELADNIAEIELYAALLEKEPPRTTLMENRPIIGKYIWQTMKYSSTTLETPSDLLSSIRRFYATTERKFSQIERDAIGVKYGAKELIKLTTRFKSGPLKALKNSTVLLKHELAEEGIIIGLLKGESSRG